MSKTGIVEVKNIVQTKYWLGDKIWVWGDVAPRQISIAVLAISIDTDRACGERAEVNYKMSNNSWWSEVKIDEAAKTKEELRIRLFGE